MVRALSGGRGSFDVGSLFQLRFWALLVVQATAESEIIWLYI